MAANGMERVLKRVLKGREGDPLESKPLVPGRDYVAADGTMLNEYFGDTDDEQVEQDDHVEHGSAEDIYTLATTGRGCGSGLSTSDTLPKPTKRSTALKMKNHISH